jgi:uncharacterized membrane protein YqjE
MAGLTQDPYSRTSRLTETFEEIDMSLTKPNPTSTTAHPPASIDLRTPPVRDERTIGQLVADISHDLSGLVRAEIALAKAELTEEAKKGGIGAGMLAAAGFFAAVAFILLCFTAAYGLVAVTLVLLAITAILALVGLKKVKQVKGPKQAIDTTKQSIETVKAAAKFDH